MLARFLSVSSTNFCNANNNGNANNNNASNTNGVDPDSLAGEQHVSCELITSLEKETKTCGAAMHPKNNRDASCLETDRSCCSRGLFYDVIDPYSLLLAYYECRKDVAWKGSVQKYEHHLIRNISASMKELESGGVVTRGFAEFDIRERGKTRHIRAVHISERVVQKSLCNNALTPILSKSLIYDNGASLEGKGTAFARRRLKVHLMRHFRKYGNVGYIVLIDCSGYFDSIMHSLLYELQEGKIDDAQVMRLVRYYIDAFGEKGLGLGSQVSQISAIFYPNKIDHYAKEALSLKQYGRYMDDSYFIVRTREEAIEKLAILESKYAEYGLKLNMKKTRIQDISKGFTYMKCKYRLTETGKILMRPVKDGQTRMARKLRKFKKKGIPHSAAKAAYITWRGYWKKLGGDPRRIDNLYNELFGGKDDSDLRDRKRA
jgi:hypothetical protein